jgi:hypothetical protein
VRPVNEPVSLTQTKVYPRFLLIVRKRSRGKRAQHAWARATRDGARDDGNASRKDAVRKCWLCRCVVVAPRHFVLARRARVKLATISKLDSDAAERASSADAPAIPPMEALPFERRFALC